MVRGFLHGTVGTFLHCAVSTFLHSTVSSFLHPMVRTSFYPLWPVLSQEEVSIGLFLVYWKAVHKRGELYADENTDATNTGPETNGLYKNGYHPLL